MATRFKYLKTRPALRLIRKTVWINSCLVIFLGLTNTALADEAPAVENTNKTDQTTTADPVPVTEQSTGQNTEQFGYVEAGMGYQSEDSFWFGRYTGLTDKGPFLIGNFDYSSKKVDGSHTEAYGRRLGLDSRSILFTHGVQGKYDLDLIFD